jgi:hypothetical protein
VLYYAPLQERFYFGDAVLPLFESGVPLLLDRLRQLPDRDNVSQARGLGPRGIAYCTGLLILQHQAKGVHA